MGNNSVPKFIFRLSWFPVYRGSVLGRFYCNMLKVKAKQSHYRPGQAGGFKEVEAPRFQDNWHIKVVRLSALGNGRLYPPENIPDTHFG